MLWSRCVTLKVSSPLMKLGGEVARLYQRSSKTISKMNVLERQSMTLSTNSNNDVAQSCSPFAWIMGFCREKFSIIMMPKKASNIVGIYGEKSFSPTVLTCAFKAMTVLPCSNTAIIFNPKLAVSHTTVLRVVSSVMVRALEEPLRRIFVDMG